MKILVTGGAGYIGSVLVPELLKDGHHVTVLDNFMYRQHSLALCCRYPNFTVHRADVRDSEQALPHLVGVDVVIPLAGLVGAPLCDQNPIDAALVNLYAQIKLLKALADDQLVIMPITESVYGENGEVCTEETPVNPLSLYGRHKVEVEEALLARRNSVSLRLATVFGMSPRMRLDLLINDFTWRAVRDRAFVVFEGHYRRTSVHVTDVVSAFVHALDVGLRGVFNVGAVHCTKIELCEAIKAQVPYFSYEEAGKAPKDQVGRDPDQRNYIVSDAKIRATGYEPVVALEAGIAELLMGYRTLSNIRYGNAA